MSLEKEVELSLLTSWSVIVLGWPPVVEDEGVPVDVRGDLAVGVEKLEPNCLLAGVLDVELVIVTRRGVPWTCDGEAIF